MGTIQLTDNSSLDFTVSSDDGNASLNKYLRNPLVFCFPNSMFRAAEDVEIRNINRDSFPYTATAGADATFSVEGTNLNIMPGYSASINVLAGEDASYFLESASLDDDPQFELLSFSITGSITANEAGHAGGFAFGLTAGTEVSLTNFQKVAPTDKLLDATKAAISGLCIPHDLDDLRSLPRGSICKMRGSGSLQFNVTFQQSFINNPLALVPVGSLPASLQINAEAGAKLQLGVTHSSTHELTIAAIRPGTVRLAVNLTDVKDLATSFQISASLDATIGGQDALELIMGVISPNPHTELEKIRSELPEEQRWYISSQIRDALHNALSSSFTASLQQSFDRSKTTSQLFAYDVDFDSLDRDGTAAVQSALKGDFRALTANTPLAGIKEVETGLTLITASSRALTVHLIGILNCSDVNSFVRTATTGYNQETGEIILAAKETKIVDNNLDKEKLREVLFRSAVMTAVTASSAANPDFKFKFVFFLQKGDAGHSDMQQFSNILGMIASPDASSAQELLRSGSGHFGITGLYLGLTLDRDLSSALFRNGAQPRDWAAYVSVAKSALSGILQNDRDPTSVGRCALLNADLTVWNDLRKIGNGAAINDILKANRIPISASTDFFAINWWASAMERFSAALIKGGSLEHAAADVLKKSEGGFDVPWALLAAYRMLPTTTARVESKFTVRKSLAAPAQA